jgi:hypothetical protein
MITDEEDETMNECKHEWKYTGYYIDRFWDGYGIDAVIVEERVDEYYCKKCDESKEESTDD